MMLSHSSRYVVSSLEMLVAEDYLIIYMNGATPRSKMPGISWLKKCYQMIDRRWETMRNYSNILTMIVINIKGSLCNIQSINIEAKHNLLCKDIVAS